MLDTTGLIADIYDSAANPEFWPKTLERIRSGMNAAYATILFSDFSSMPANGWPVLKLHATSWDGSWFAKLEKYLDQIPHVDVMFRDGVDCPWTQMEHITEDDFRKTVFYKEWAGPQGLRDVINTMYFDRQMLRGNFSIAGDEKRALFNAEDKTIAGILSPHVRRALAINDLVDKGNLTAAMYRSVLDQLSTAVFVVRDNARLVFTNASGDRMLTDGAFIKLSHGVLTAAMHDPLGLKLNEAVARAMTGDTSLGIRGIGVPLRNLAGERLAAYVLPLKGSELRSDIGNGLAIVFIAQRGEQQPMVTEILRTLYDLTPAEAKVAHATAMGEQPAVIAAAQGTSVDTVRFHLKNIYGKTDATDKTALAAQVNAVVPPVVEK